MKKRVLLLSVSMLLLSCAPTEASSATSANESQITVSTSSSESEVESSSIMDSTSSSEESISSSDSIASSSASTSSSSTSSSSSSSSGSSSTSSSSSQTSSVSLTSEVNDYYKSINTSLTGNTLKTALYNLIKNANMSVYSYNTCDTYIADANEDPNNSNNLIEFYTGRSMPKTYNKISASAPDAWNKEHVWAKSHGGFASMVAGKDIHHLMPTDNGVNGARSSKDFDDCTSDSNAVTQYNSYHQKVTVQYADPLDRCYTTSSVFEPRDAVKGDVARIIFYMATRYEGNSDGGPDLEINESTSNGSSPYIGKLSTLLKWHEQDPVDSFEQKRNNYIYSVQNNRNPYIDHPEFANQIFASSYL